MNYLKGFLVVIMILSTGGLRAQSIKEIEKKNAEDLKNLRIMCLDKKEDGIAYSPMQRSQRNRTQENRDIKYVANKLYTYLEKKTNHVRTFIDGETAKYTFDNVPYSYKFDADAQYSSDNRYKVKITSSSSNDIVPKTFFVNAIRKPGDTNYQYVDPQFPGKVITQEQYNEINIMPLTFLYCWAFDVRDWGTK